MHTSLFVMTLNVQTNVRRQKVDLEFVPSFSMPLLETNDQRRSTTSPRKSRPPSASTFCRPAFEKRVQTCRRFSHQKLSPPTALVSTGSGRRVRKVGVGAKRNRPKSELLVRREVSFSVSALVSSGLWLRHRSSVKQQMLSAFVGWSERRWVSSTFLEEVFRAPKVARIKRICPGNTMKLN